MRRLFGFPVLDMDWNGVLAFFEGHLKAPRRKLTVSFFDENAALRQLVDPAYRDLLSQRALLPAAGTLSRTWERLTRKDTASAHFRVERFAPALLTFLAEGRRIALVGEEMGAVGRLREELSAHAPWHEFMAIATSQIGEHRDDFFDLILVQAGSPAEERRIEPRLSGLHTSLVVIVGTGLDKFEAERPAFRFAAAAASIEESAAA
ncbi:hypothetical protein LCM4573_13895 [Rhizobium sp. LCM 4573]|nr:hypothetical protein LCM4573_13895 [Rhizobium sp. LCM 4573]